MNHYRIDEKQYESIMRNFKTYTGNRYQGYVSGDLDYYLDIANPYFYVQTDFKNQIDAIRAAEDHKKKVVLLQEALDL